MEKAAPYAGFGSKQYRAYALGMLVVVYTFNFIDRVLLGVIQEAIKRDLRIDDFQLGLLGGPFFALLFTLAGIPIARYAERHNRISIIALGAAAWSVMTAACGFAANFAQLALARIGVGIGEAACTPPAHSVLSDYFPPERRASALAIYGLGIPIGTMLAAVGGGWLAANLNWRAAFWLLGAPGVLVAVLLKLTVREPPRGGASEELPGFVETLRALTRKPTFWHFALASSAMALVGYASAQFLVSFLVRNFDLGPDPRSEQANASLAFGAIAGFAVAIGTFLGGYLCDRLSPRHPRVHAWLPALGVAVALPLYLLAFAQSWFWAGFAILMVAPIFHYLYIGPTFAVVQSIAPPRMRATASAALILVINLIGYGLGPPALGALSNVFANLELAPLGLSVAACKGPEAAALCAPGIAHGLRSALFCVTCVLVWPAAQFWFARRTLARDFVG